MTTSGAFLSSAGQEAGSEAGGFFLSITFCVFACVFLAIFSRPEASQWREIQLDDRINPNDACVESLVRLPGIGPGRAERIVEYRNSFNSETGGAAFETREDLENVHGIGPKTVRDLSKWLKFE